MQKNMDEPRRVVMAIRVDGVMRNSFMKISS